MYETLSRGGFLIQTSQGPLQIGIPPETIKDTMMTEGGVPEIFVLPNVLFHWNKGISLAELEFPLYFNFFIRGKKTRVITDSDRVERIYKVLQESLFGPKDLRIEDNYDPDFMPSSLPELGKEMAFFKGNMSFDDLLELVILKDSQADLGNGLLITKTRDGQFLIDDQGSEKISVPGDINYQPRFKIGQPLKEAFEPPLFGITCLGPSHGFDPTENTSGYILWLNHSGIMIDPPVDSTLWLEQSHVKPKLIDSIILTHCHADHDAGTFQKIMEEGRVTIYTTHTIMESFLRKFAAVTGESEEYLAQLFSFEPVYIDKPFYINGGLFNFRFSLHSIPTIGFMLRFQDKSFVYSSDHQNDPAIHKEMRELGIIDDVRYEELNTFFWDADVIYHESGIAPLHTPISFLNSLPEDIQKKVTVYHIAKKDFPQETKLSLASFGIDETLYFDCSIPSFDKTYQVMTLFDNLEFLQDLSFRRIRQTIGYMQEEFFKEGEQIIKKGDKGSRFYLIASGQVQVIGEREGDIKFYGPFDYFGEGSALTGRPRSADVFALSNVTLYSLNHEQFLRLIEGTDFNKALHRLVEIRNFESWEVFQRGGLSRKLTSYQITWLESIMTCEELQGSGVLIKSGQHPDYLYILIEGKVYKDDCLLDTGSIIGSFELLYKHQASFSEYRYEGSLKVYRMERQDILDFLHKNPGLIMKMDRAH
ncbi:cAMP/cGMP-dependent 3',5'-cyclic-AMP/GMP phosphodiesterase [Spirochaeta cellobiosiphila]|uniref:cAMP/cGMP-dependent 3',5'-cyclic-AMP/GMP phosphodiesterase n=1 Tax=Spirochaeta cellobiosiphila TaxID=504483 RepID=UPI0003FED74F|nr:cAMP/cGMP-dependent 3',5'-cyclic-AMP/GMP phosphodiesterase [Spirochaeta cellobiosiphila]